VLIRFRARNFRSFKEEQEFSLAANSPGAPVKASPSETLQLHRVAAIYGSNASGKTNTLKALDFLKNAVRESQKLWPPARPLPREPFLLDPGAKRDSSFFEAELLLDGTHFRYGFTLNDQEILEERLDAYPGGKRQMWLRREGGGYTFGEELATGHQDIQHLTRPNSLFLSAAAQAKHPSLLPLYQWFTMRLRYLPLDRRGLLQRAARMCRNEAWKASLLRILRTADAGITRLDVHQENLLAPFFEPQDPQSKALLGDLIGPLRKLLSAAKEEDPAAADLWEKKQVFAFLHQGAEAEVELEEIHESDGTLAFLGLLAAVLEAIQSGGTLFVDDVNASLHPVLALKLVRLFNNPKISSRGAQIVFTTQDTSLLGAAALRRDQVWFTEKDSQGRSHLYSLSDFFPGKNEKLPRGYLQGRYGPIPFWGWENFFAKLDERTSR
jgi:predicted ATPase